MRFRELDGTRTELGECGGIKSYAIFSSDEKFRYILQRDWDIELPLINFLMLNPSTATQDINDPTVARCYGYAKRLGYGAMIVTNLFAVRSTNPIGIRFPDAEGKHNNFYIAAAAEQAETTVCAWGNHGALFNRSNRVMEMLQAKGIETWALRMTKMNEPSHPLYLPSRINPFKFSRNLR